VEGTETRFGVPGSTFFGVAATGSADGAAGRDSRGNPGAHGLSEILYAYTSNANSNGSAMAGLGGNTIFYNLTMTAVMLLGRYPPITLVLLLASQRPGVVTAGPPRTHGATFVLLTSGTAAILAWPCSISFSRSRWARWPAASRDDGRVADLHDKSLLMAI
jgi:K+-transporting ATPase A subunit